MTINFNSIIYNSSSKNFKNRYHLLFISLLLVNYFFPLLIFNEITLFYHDNLDSMVVYHHVLGKFYRGDVGSIDSFLAGKIKIEYLRHLLKPYSLLYGIFGTELAYWIIDFLTKITCYFSFFLFAKKTSKNIFLCCLLSCLFACVNTPPETSFGIAIFPYLIYLILYKKNLNFKHYLILVFFALNTDLVEDIFFFPVVILVLLIIDSKIIKEKFSNIIKILTIFLFFMIISSSNLIFAQLFSEPFHREEFFRAPIPLLNNISSTLFTLLKIPTSLTWTLFKKLPYAIFLIPLIFLSLFSKNKTVYKFLFFIFFIYLILFLSNLETIRDLRNNYSGLIKTFNISGIITYIPILHFFLFLYLIKTKEWFYKFLIYPSFISILFFQINSSLIPIGKKYFLENNNGEYKNIYTFNGYYSYDAYKEIKQIVKNKRVLSVGLDPMVAIMNNIKTIDGYHALYPLSYKAEFRRIIEKELESNEELRKYYDHWGSRVYAFISNPDNVLINFKTAKEIGADYILSKFNLNSDDLVLVCKECKNNFYLYEIK